MIATSLLPIGNQSLVYGSDDGGQTVHKSSKRMNKIMKAAGMFLKMKPHRVGFRDPKIIYGPCDIEGHLGRDNKFYVCDTARCFAPEVPSYMFMALQIDCDPPSPPGITPDVQSLPPIKEIELSVAGWKTEAVTYLGEAFRTAIFVGGTLLYGETGNLNSRASALVGMIIFFFYIFIFIFLFF